MSKGEDKMHITIVDDVQENLMNYKQLLKNEFRIELIQKPIELLGYLNTNKTDLILLDLHMPNINGFELFEKMRKTHPNIPVVFLTGDPSEDVLLKGLELGAQDFIVKPVSINELTARIKNKVEAKKAKHRRKKGINLIKVNNYDFALNPDLQSAVIADNNITLTPIEYKIIHLLVSNPNKIFSREYLAEIIWADTNTSSQNIDTHLSNLRKKLKPFSAYIKTIKSRGILLRV